LESSSSSSLSGSGSRAFEYVGFWKRFVASVIDSLLLLVVLVPALLLLYRDDPREGFTGPGAGAELAIQVAVAIVYILFWRYRGATPGKMAISARIVDAKTGGAPSTGSLVARYVGYIVSMLPLMLGFIWVALDRRKQGFHDKIAGTVVVYDDD